MSQLVKLIPGPQAVGEIESYVREGWFVFLVVQRPRDYLLIVFERLDPLPEQPEVHGNEQTA